MPTNKLAKDDHCTIPDGFSKATIELKSDKYALVHFDGADHKVTEHHQVARMKDVSIMYTNKGPGDVLISYK